MIFHQTRASPPPRDKEPPVNQSNNEAKLKFYILLQVPPAAPKATDKRSGLPRSLIFRPRERWRLYRSDIDIAVCTLLNGINLGLIIRRVFPNRRNHLN